MQLGGGGEGFEKFHTFLRSRPWAYLRTLVLYKAYRVRNHNDKLSNVVIEYFGKRDMMHSTSKTNRVKVEIT